MFPVWGEGIFSPFLTTGANAQTQAMNVKL